jgi:hypothetical protein
MQCIGNNVINGTVLAFNCNDFTTTGSGIASILTDSASGTPSGSFNMQPGTYEVEFSASGVANVGGCGSEVLAQLNGNNLAGGQASQCAVGTMAWSGIVQAGLNQVLKFVIFTPGGLTLGQGYTLIITKLQ